MEAFGLPDLFLRELLQTQDRIPRVYKRMPVNMTRGSSAVVVRQP